MLAKVPRPGKSFSGLRRYLIAGSRGSAHNPDRVAFVATRNLMTTDPALATKIMTSTAALSARTQRPVYHGVVSFRADEKPSHADMLFVVDRMLEDLGLAEHQVLIVGHADTANPHVHVEINRVHPETGRAWATSHDYRRIEAIMREHANNMGFIVVPPSHLTKRQRQGKQPATSSISLPQLGTRGAALTSVIKQAASWSALHAALASHGLVIAPKGQGFVLTAPQGSVKLSSLGLRARDLISRLGAFRPPLTPQGQSNQTPLPDPEPQP